MEEELLGLARNLRREEIFVRQERDLIEQLHRDLVEVRYRKLIEDLFVCQSELWFVDDIFKHAPETVMQAVPSPGSSPLGRFAQIHQMPFVEARNAGLETLQEMNYAEFLEKLRLKPTLVGQMLTYCETVYGQTQLVHLTRTVFASLYAGCLTAEDEQCVLQVLKYLIDVQVAVHDNPRLLLQKGQCAFSKLFQLYIERLPAAKVYLTAALYQPLVCLLKEDTRFYDMDEQSMMSRFRPERALAVFGPPGSEDYRRKYEEYKSARHAKLAQLAENFVQSLRATASAFPMPLVWLLGQLATYAASRLGRTEVLAISADFVFSRFVSSAICEPERFGITGDFAISKVARHNLMQISKVIQVLSCISGFSQTPEPREFFSRFDPSCLTSLMSCLLEVAEGMVSLPPPSSGLAATSGMPGPPAGQASLVSRTVAPVTRPGLQVLVATVRQVADRLPAGCADRTVLDNMLNGLPAGDVPDTRSPPPSAGTGGAGGGAGGGDSNSPRPKLKFPHLTMPRSTRTGTTTGSHLFSSDSPSLPGDGGEDASGHEGAESVLEVILIPLDPCAAACDPKLLLPEAKVLEAAAGAGGTSVGRKSNRVSIQPPTEGANEGMQPAGGEKRTRFSLSHDQESVDSLAEITCTTSDYLEGVSEVAVSEVASFHSAASIESQEDEADGLSDMISANVSGRGTPSISGGRDSPLSVGDLPPAGPPVVVHKPQPDVTEKFGKFDIPQAYRGVGNSAESRSVVSDTWSTDVQGSADSEANAQERLEEIAEEMVRENVSEDHWSVDVLCDNEDKASERMNDFDMDELDELSTAGSTTASQSDFGSGTLGPAIRRKGGGTRRYGGGSSLGTAVGAGGGSGGGDSGDESRLFAPPPPPPPHAGRPSSARQAGSVPSGGGGTSREETVDDLEVLRQQQQRTQRQQHRAGRGGQAPPVTSTPGGAASEKHQQQQQQQQQQKKNRGIQWHPTPLVQPPQHQTSVECESNAGSVASEPVWGSNSTHALGSRSGKKIVTAELETNCRRPRGSGSLRDRMKDKLNNNTAKGAGSESELPFFDANNLEKCQAFAEIKRNLRIVLSGSGTWATGLDLVGDLPSTPMMSTPPMPFSNLINFSANVGSAPSSTTSSSSSSSSAGNSSGPNALVRSLRLQIAHAINMQESERLAQLQETLRLARLFDEKSCSRLLASMERDWRLRQVYVAYLTRTRQQLCLLREEVDAASRRLRCDRRIGARNLNRVCVERFLDDNERELAEFHARFARPLNDYDDRRNTEDVKRELMETTLNKLFQRLEASPFWRNVNSSQFEEARTYMEQMIFARVYYEAMFLNDYEADKQRDEILHRELEHLSESITENHPTISIPRQFHSILPFQHAQDELRMINVFKTPGEKVRCIERTANIIASLQRLCSDGVSGADDLFPAMLYVLIKVNPPMLKATIQFVETFYGQQIKGTEAYWWSTFQAAVTAATQMIAAESSAPTSGTLASSE